MAATMHSTPARGAPKKHGRTESKVEGFPKVKKYKRKPGRGGFRAASAPTPIPTVTLLKDRNISAVRSVLLNHAFNGDQNSTKNVNQLEKKNKSTTVSSAVTTAKTGKAAPFVIPNEWKEHISQASLEKRKYPADYNKPTDIKGACPLFTETVLSHHEDIANDNADKHQLNGTALDRKDLATEKSVLEEFAKSALFSEWTSELLPPALNLKTSKPPEKSLQTLFLAVGIPPFVLVMYEPDSSGQEEESARNYASEIARVLTRSLLNYCHCEFILLACALPRDKFSEERLSKEVEERRQQTSKIYYRRQRLNRSEYLKLKEAVTIVSRVSPVNQHLAGTQSGAGSDKTSQTLVILDQAWYNLVLYFVKIMDESLGKTKEDSQGFNFTRACPPNVISKAKAAAKEAGKRLGLNVQTTQDKDLQHLKLRVEKPLEQK